VLQVIGLRAACHVHVQKALRWHCRFATRLQAKHWPARQ
jgi:hypothetical protein